MGTLLQTDISVFRTTILDKYSGLIARRYERKIVEKSGHNQGGSDPFA